MNFPHKVYASKRDRRKNIAFVAVFSVLMLVPSFLIFKSVFHEYNQEDKESVEKLNARVVELPDEDQVRETIIEELENKDDFYVQDSTKFNQVCSDLKIFFPNIKEFGLAVSQTTNFDDHEKGIPTVIVKWDRPRGVDVQKLTEFIKRTYKLDTLKVAITN